MRHMISVGSRRWHPYLLATGAGLAAATCQWLIEPLVGGRVPFLLVPVVLFVGLRLGRRPAMIVIAIGAVNLLLVMSQSERSVLSRPENVTALCFYLALTFGAALLGGRLRVATARAADTERRLLLAQENTGMGVFELDYAAGTAYISAGLSRLLGRPVFDGPIPLKEWLESLDQAHREGSARSIKERLAQGDLSYEREMTVLLPDGKTRWLLSRITLERDAKGSLSRAYGATVDITERKILDEKLAAAQVELEAQRRLEQERLIAADKRKDEFLATLAHELRSPLAPIRQAVMILETAGLDDIRRRKSLQIMERQVQRMALLLEDLLDVSRVSRGTVQIRRSEASLRSVIDAAIETSKPLRDAKRQEIVIAMPEKDLGVNVDSLRISQVVTNLLANAAKYSEEQSTIFLDVTVSGADVSIKVRDTGIGLAAEHIESIFEMFVQAPEGLTSSQGGLGIGLSLARSIVELHGGRLTARSEGLGRGCVFEAFLPEVLCSLPHLESADSEERGPRQTALGSAALVLIADDNCDSAETLAELLRLAGHDVHVAFDGLQALEIFGRARPELVLLDVGMPRMSGLDAARHIRALPHGAGATLIAITGWGQELDRKKTIAAGFDLHITKPVDPKTLNAIIRAVQNGQSLPSPREVRDDEAEAEVPGLRLA